MRVEDSQYKFTIGRVKSTLIFALIVVSAVLGLLMLMSVLLWVKVTAMFLVGLFGGLTVAQFCTATVDQLIYRPTSNQWLLNDCVVRLRSDQFLTRHLIIIYFIADNGKKFTQLVPADSMSGEQHRRLRKLLIESVHTANRDQPQYPVRQN